MEGKDSNQGLAPKQIISKPHFKTWCSKPKISDKTKTKHNHTPQAEEVGCDCGNLERAWSSHRVAPQLPCSPTWEPTKEAQYQLYVCVCEISRFSNEGKQIYQLPTALNSSNPDLQGYF